MNTATLAENTSVWPVAAIEKKRLRHPLLAALQNTEFGQLTMTTPEGEQLMFLGLEHGPLAHMQLSDWSVLDEGVSRGEMGFVDSYIDGRWDSRDLPAMLTFALMNAPVLERFFYGRPWYALWMRVREWLHSNTVSGSRRNIMAHYDLGNDFYALWLDKGMTYSCGLFEGDSTRTLEEAQKAKHRRILKKLNAVPGEHVLDIGCGWGGFAEEAARAGLRVTALTISEAQSAYAQERLERAGCSHLVSIQQMDYRKVAGMFDHIVSIGMFEHVGEKFWPVYFDTIREHLKPGGNAMIQSITLDDRLFESLHNHYGFIEYYIFPGGLLPSKTRFRAAAAKAGLSCREIFSFGQDYTRTLRLWLERFESNLPRVKQQGYDEPFIRLWRFYLASCIASFVSCRTDVMQVELTHTA